MRSSAKLIYLVPWHCRDWVDDRRLGHGKQLRNRLHLVRLLLVNRIPPQLTALQYFVLDGGDPRQRQEQADVIRQYIICRTPRLDERLRRIVDRADVA
jgi:hypothetical protein